MWYVEPNMIDAGWFRAVLIEGAIGGALLSLIAFLLSRFVKDIVGRTLLATVHAEIPNGM